MIYQHLFTENILNKARLGKEIKKWRKIRKLTQCDLAFEICHQSEVSRIEKGEVFPSIDTLYLFSSKLKIPISYFYEALIYEDVDYKNTLFKEISTLSKYKKFDEILKISEEILSKEIVHPEILQFILWQYYISLFYIKKTDLQTTIYNLKKLLTKKNSGMNIYIYLHIKNSLANLFAENKEFEKSIALYKEILTYEISNEYILDLKIKVLYNYGKALFIKEKFEESLEQINKGINISIRYHNMKFIGQLFYQKGECLEKLNYPKKEISQVYQKAYFFFNLQELNIYKSILEKNKINYFNKL